MATAKLRKVGGSVMLAIPPSLLDTLQLTSESVLNLSADKGALVARPTKPRYTLEALLAECDSNSPVSTEDREWVDAPNLGCELP